MVINQFHAIGDIIFLEPMFKRFSELMGMKPIVPIRDHLMWLQEYIHSAEFVPMSKFVLDYDSMATNNPDYFPARFANQVLRKLKPDDHHDFENMMLDKYRLACMPEDLWKTIDLHFNDWKCMELMHHLNLFDEETGDVIKYVLINENCQAGTIKIDLDGIKHIKNGKISDIKVIKMHEIEGFTPIDWAFVMLNAEENHHVSTSTFFILQALWNKYKFTNPVFLYPRPNIDGLRGISQLKPSFNYIKSL